MEIKAGDYVRVKATGHLHRVQVVGSCGLHTVRIRDAHHDLVKPGDVEKVVNVSLYPGDSETTHKRVA